MKELNKRFGVVVNRYGIGNDDVIKYCDANNIPIMAKISNSRQIAEIYSSGKLIFKEIPEVRQQLENIRSFIMNEMKEGMA